MTERLQFQELPHQQGRDWVVQSLSNGHEVSAAVLAATPLASGRFLALVSPQVTDERDTHLEEGGVTDSKSADAALTSLLDGLITGPAGCVVVEDDALRRADPAVALGELPTAFIGEHVLHWYDFASSSNSDAATVIRAGATGYPLNAFVLTRGSHDLGLVQGASLPRSFAAEVAQNLAAVIVSAFDAETFVIWDQS